MNARELKTIKDAAERFMKGSVVTKTEENPNAVKVELPLLDCDKNPVNIYVVKGNKGSKFHIMYFLAHPTDKKSVMTFVTEELKEVIDSYDLSLSEGIIDEKNKKIPLQERIGKLAHAVLGIDGIRRLARVALNRRRDAKSKVIEQQSSTANNS